MLRMAHDAARSRFLGARCLVVDGVAGRTRLAHTLAHRLAFISGGVAIEAFGASLPPPRDVEEMKLLHQVVLLRGSPQPLPPPLGLRHACPLPFTIHHRVAEHPSVRRAELLVMEDHPVVMAGRTTSA